MFKSDFFQVFQLTNYKSSLKYFRPWLLQPVNVDFFNILLYLPYICALSVFVRLLLYVLSPALTSQHLLPPFNLIYLHSCCAVVFGKCIRKKRLVYWRCCSIKYHDKTHSVCWKAVQKKKVCVVLFAVTSWLLFWLVNKRRQLVIGPHLSDVLCFSFSLVSLERSTSLCMFDSSETLSLRIQCDYSARAMKINQIISASGAAFLPESRSNCAVTAAAVKTEGATAWWMTDTNHVSLI